MAGKQISGAVSLDRNGLEQSVGLAQSSMRKVMGFKDGRTAAETLAARLRGSRPVREGSDSSATLLPVEAATQEPAANDGTPSAAGHPDPLTVSRPTPADTTPVVQGPQWWSGDAALEVEEISITAPDELQVRGTAHRSEPSAPISGALSKELQAGLTTIAAASDRSVPRPSRADAALPETRGVRLGWLFLTLAGLLAVALLAWR